METPSKKPAPAQFSPVILSDSPVKLTPQKGNLTGNTRVIRDLVADLYNWVQAWNRHHLDGYNILKNIADLKVPALKGSQLYNNGAIYPDGLQILSDELISICGMLVCNLVFVSATVTGMNKVVHQMNAVITLEKLHSKNNIPLFLTWGADKFGESCQQISSAYNCELEVKQCVTSEVSHCKSEPELMLHLAAWVYQPFVSHIHERTLESLLIETGHR